MKKKKKKRKRKKRNCDYSCIHILYPKLIDKTRRLISSVQNVSVSRVESQFPPTQGIKGTSLTKINLSYNNAITAATIVFRAHSCTRNQIHLVLC